MSESPNSNKYPAWEDISLEEINVLIAEGKIADALFLTKSRHNILKRASAEIAFPSQPGQIPLENSETIKKDLDHEIGELEKVIEQYKNIS